MRGRTGYGYFIRAYAQELPAAFSVVVVQQKLFEKYQMRISVPCIRNWRKDIRKISKAARGLEDLQPQLDGKNRWEQMDLIGKQIKSAEEYQKKLLVQARTMGFAARRLRIRLAQLRRDQNSAGN